MDINTFFSDNKNLTPFSNSILNIKTSVISKLIKELISRQDISRDLNNASGIQLTTKNKNKRVIKKISYCTDFDTKINSIIGAFNYEFVYIVLNKIYLKEYLLKLIKTESIEKVLNIYEDEVVKSQNILYFSETFKNQFEKTSFYSFHFENSNYDLIKIIEKIKFDLSKTTITTIDEIENNIREIIFLLINEIQISKTIEINEKTFDSKLTDNGYIFFKTSLLIPDYEKTITDLKLNKYVSEELSLFIGDINFQQIISKIKEYLIVEKLNNEIMILISQSLIKRIVNYFIYFVTKFVDKIESSVLFIQSSRIQFIHIYETILLTIPFKLSEEEKNFIHFILLTNKDFNHIYKNIEQQK